LTEPRTFNESNSACRPVNLGAAFLPLVLQFITHPGCVKPVAKVRVAVATVVKDKRKSFSSETRHELSSSKASALLLPTPNASFSKGSMQSNSFFPLDATSQTTGVSVLPESKGLMSDRVSAVLFVEAMRPVCSDRYDGLPDPLASEGVSHTLLSRIRGQGQLAFDSTSVFTGPGQTLHAAGCLNQPC